MSQRDNPFRERPVFKKRIISASITEEQEDAINEMRNQIEREVGEALTIGGLIKIALAEKYERMMSAGRPE
jgi:hypothetical protein